MPDATARSAAKIDLARRNGALSRGPITAAGKARSARNAIRHGLCARIMVLVNGDDTAVAALRAAIVARHRPRGEAERRCVDELVSLAWGQRRLLDLEAAAQTGLVDLGFRSPPAIGGDAAPLSRTARSRRPACGGGVGSSAPGAPTRRWHERTDRYAVHERNPPRHERTDAGCGWRHAAASWRRPAEIHKRIRCRHERTDRARPAAQPAPAASPCGAGAAVPGCSRSTRKSMNARTLAGRWRRCG